MVTKLLLAAALLTCGRAVCALDLAVAGARFQVPVHSLKQVRFSHTLRQQYDFSCGSAALATLLTYHYAHPVSEQDIFTAMFLRGDQNKIRKEGFSLLDMQRFLAAHGYQADGFELPLDRLLQAGLPALVLIAEKGYLHFVVIKGIRDGRVLLGDPSRGTRSMSAAGFASVWVGRLLFVIHGYGKRPVRFNDAADWRSAPLAPLAMSLPRDGLPNLALPRHGPGDF